LKVKARIPARTQLGGEEHEGTLLSQIKVKWTSKKDGAAQVVQNIWRGGRGERSDPTWGWAIETSNRTGVLAEKVFPETQERGVGGRDGKNRVKTHHLARVIGKGKGGLTNSACGFGGKRLPPIN